MVDHLENKKVPWPQFDAYIKLNQESILALYDLEKK
jgi:hypothetical protein